MNWIETRLRLPGIGVRVLVWSEGRLPEFGHRNESGLWYTSQGQAYPTHWAKVYPPIDARAA